MTGKTKKKKGRGVYRAQFSMGQQDYERLHAILMQIDFWGTRAWDRDEEAIRPLYSFLFQFYKNIRWLVLDKENMDKEFKIIYRLIINISTFKKRNFPYQYMLPDLFERLSLMTDKIYEIKQFVGLGMDIQKVLSQKKKWERALHISSD